MKPTVSPQITKTSPIMLMLMRAYDKLEEMINSKTDSQILMRQEAIIEKLNARVEQEGTGMRTHSTHSSLTNSPQQGFDALLNPRLEIGEEQQKVELKSGMRLYLHEEQKICADSPKGQSHGTKHLSRDVAMKNKRNLSIKQIKRPIWPDWNVEICLSLSRLKRAAAATKETTF